MKFATLILFGLVLSVFEPVKCLKEAQDNTESVDAGESATENTSSDEIITIVDSSNVSARNLAPKTCTCNDNVKNQNVPAISAVQEDLATPREELTKTSKKTNGNKKYRVITITLPDESEASAEIISGLGQEASGQIVSSYIKDEVAEVPKEEKEEKMVDDEEKVANNDEKNADNLEQQQDATSIKKSKKESKSKADERTKKSGKYDNEKRSKRDTKGSSKGGRNKSKSNSKNKESKRGGNKNRK